MIQLGANHGEHSHDPAPDSRRPISVLIVAGLYVLVGTAGFVIHFPNLHAIQSDDVIIEVTELVALVAGIYLLRRQNWARWVAMAWIVAHIAISFTDGAWPVVVHSLIGLAIAWMLFRPAAAQYFRRASTV
jgi:hypothetical protein